MALTIVSRTSRPTTKVPPCDTCGAPAVECCIDIRRTDKPGDKWVSYEPIDGSNRSYCAAHPRPSRSFDQNGNEEQGA
jgi:hypothetical protein